MMSRLLRTREFLRCNEPEISGNPQPGSERSDYRDAGHSAPLTSCPICVVSYAHSWLISLGKAPRVQSVEHRLDQRRFGLLLHDHEVVALVSFCARKCSP